MSFLPRRWISSSFWFQIPMRGNETRLRPAQSVFAPFQIPMRGNEARLRPALAAAAAAFQIPMRGNENYEATITARGNDGFKSP